MSFLLTRIPSALVAPLSGLMADRLDRRRIMIACDLLGAVTSAGMAVTGRPLPLILLGTLAALLHSPFGLFEDRAQAHERTGLEQRAGEAEFDRVN